METTATINTDKYSHYHNNLKADRETELLPTTCQVWCGGIKFLVCKKAEAIRQRTKNSR